MGPWQKLECNLGTAILLCYADNSPACHMCLDSSFSNLNVFDARLVQQDAIRLDPMRACTALCYGATGYQSNLRLQLLPLN